MADPSRPCTRNDPGLRGPADRSRQRDLDLDGARRFADDASVAESGCGAPSVVDIGAYERPGVIFDPVVPGDITGDGVVDFQDLLFVLTWWGDRGECSLADLDVNGAVGHADLLILLFYWS